MKIFGIGLGKTGTSSLTQALRMLGYNIFHQADISFLPELKKLIDETDGGTDAPVAYAYKELDKMYPDSKWILTTRELDSWLKSIKWMLSDVGKTSEEDLKLRALLYGDVEFNKEKYTKAFEKHHREVLEYFKDREDFLIMKIEDGDFNWERLCNFLGVEIPNTFPHKFKSRKPMKRWDIIQYIINKKNYKSYLEIGVRRRDTFDRIECEHKDGVDPNGQGNFKMKSDEFFSKNRRLYDIIFIDGLHTDEQVTKDIENSLFCLSDNGVIVLHDCNPSTIKHQQVPRIQKAWNGTVWKAFVRLRCTEPFLEMFVVNIDHGCGIIRRGVQKLYVKASLRRCLMWNYFKRNKQELLDLISVRDFRRRFK